MPVISDEAIAAAPGYNETEIRFYVIDPIMRKLGYPDADDVYLKLEEKLEYPYTHVGRRSKKDLPVGFSDYRAGVKGARGSFIVEAKAGAVKLTEREVEQAHSYAAHAQVGANYFVLCNGSVITVSATLSGPKAPPIVEIPLAELNARFHELENLLCPASLERNCRITHDTRLKLADGLGSSVRIRTGHYLLEAYDVQIIAGGEDFTDYLRANVPQIAQVFTQMELLKDSFEMRVSDGRAERGEDGKIVAHVEFGGVTVHNQQAMKMMGINEANFITADEKVSDDPNNPTIFESLKDFEVARGTAFPQLFGGTTEMDADVAGDLFMRAAMYHDRGVMRGEYIALSEQQFAVPGMPEFTVKLDIAGTFELTLDV